MSDLCHDDPLPSVDDLLAATDWAGQLAAARERRAAALAGREPRPGLPETKPWESPDYLAVTAPASPAAIALPGPRLTGTPVLGPAPRRKHPVIAMAAAGLVVGGLLSPGIAERTALWLVTPAQRGGDMLEAHSVRRAEASPEAAGVREPAAAVVAAQAEPAAFPQTGVAQVAVPHVSSADMARVTLPDAGDPSARQSPALSEFTAGAVLPRAPASATAVDRRAAASPEAGAAPAGLSVAPADDAAAVAMPDMRAPFAHPRPVVTLPEMAAGAELPRGDAPPVRPIAFAAVDALRAGLPESGIFALPRAVPEPRRAEVVGGLTPAAPGDSAPALAGEVQPRIVVFMPDGEDPAAASAALASLGDAGFTADVPGRVGFRVARTHVRHYHKADAARASAVAAAVGGEARDFTGFRPLPPPGTIEVWLAGVPRAAPVAIAQVDVTDRPSRTPGPRFILAIHPDGSRERLRVIEDGGGVVTQAGRGVGVRGGDGEAGFTAGGGGGSAEVARGGGASQLGGHSGGAPSPGGGASPGAVRDPGAPAGGDGGGGGNAGGRGGGNGQGGENGHGNGHSGGNGHGNGNGGGKGHGNGNGGGNGKGNDRGNGKGGRG